MHVHKKRLGQLWLAMSQLLNSNKISPFGCPSRFWAWVCVKTMDLFFPSVSPSVE